MEVWTVHGLDADVLAGIQRVADEAEREVRDWLPALRAAQMLIVDLGPMVIPETGETGSAVAPGIVSWTADPSHPAGVLRIAEQHLRHTLFHELHHQVRGWLFHGGRPVSSFMDGVIAEGMATAFTRDAAGEDAPWATYPDEVDEWIAELAALPISADYGAWMFEHPDGRRHVGYRAGTAIVDRAMHAAGCTAADLVVTPTAEILRLGGVGVPQ